MRVQLLKSRFFPELRGPGPATPSPSSPQPRRVRPPVRRPRAGSGLRVVLGSRTGLPSGASPRDTRPDPRLQKPSGRGKGVGRRRAVAHHQRKERCHCCRVPLTTLSCSSYQQGNRHLLKSTMDEQKNIPERGCHRNCARRAAMHRENAPSKEERKEVILKLLFPSVLKVFQAQLLGWMNKKETVCNSRIGADIFTFVCTVCFYLLRTLLSLGRKTNEGKYPGVELVTCMESKDLED
ncbi:uncharacterized protein LOC116662776 isoform X2 [Camelus ferus]|uniref:Uncharacterized protein LOC116662776 isoform X2 n=1 Tax=Camelus ferus TaxID=419612 RepID=A0A8B8SS88_CAMFR|nr:uncharacterized protein LOC116662776 isoform X2 [Camelus ferus]